jgi:phenylacetate-CoA oxygenase PaaH subunit
VIWEIFRQERPGAAFQHGGSLEAPDRAFAEAYAKEFYGRRNESAALWLVPRDEIVEVDHPYVADVFDRDYRRVDGYSLKAKLREARERAGTAAD